MKLAALLWALIASSALAQITLDVKETATGKLVNRKWYTDWGSYDKDFFRTKTLSVEARNISRKAPGGEVEINVFWLAKQLKDGVIHPHYRSRRQWSFGAMTSYREEITCPSMESSVLNLAALDERYVSGSKFFGWLVVVTLDGRPIAAKASGPEQLAMAKPEPLGRLISETKAEDKEGFR